MTDQAAVSNRLLRSLPEKIFSWLRPYMDFVELPQRTVLVEPRKITTHVNFIESGLASIVARSPDDEVVEIGHVGHEGFTGCHIALMSRRTPNRTFMQVAGSGIAVPAAIFSEVLDDSPDARRLILRYVQAYQVQLAYTSLANARYSMSQRLARWLLMCQDRVGDELHLTHEFLSLMLGVRRSGVTDQLHILEGLHCIRTKRGVVHIRDRGHLEEIAGGCYGVPEKEYERLLGEEEDAVVSREDTAARSSRATLVSQQ